MDRARRHKPRGLSLAALAVVLAPHAALSDLSAVDLSQLRASLRSINAEVSHGLSAPADVAGLWARLPVDFSQTPQTESVQTPAHSPVAAASFSDSAFLSQDIIVDPAPTTPVLGGSLFDLQNARVSGTPAPKALPKGISFTQPSAVAPAPQSAATLGKLVPNADPAGAATVPQDVDTTNFRLLLASLAQVYTGRNDMAVVNAQGARGPLALSVRAGTVTLADLQSYAAANGMPPRADGTLTGPVVIWPGATLRLSPGERLGLARDMGAFVLSLGALEIDGAVIEAVGAENPHTPSFTPFVTVGAGGSLSLQNATLKGLGFGQTPKYSGLSVARNLMTPSEGKVVIRNTLFDGLKTVSIAGANGAELTGNTFQNARSTTLSLVNAPSTRVSENLFAGSAPTNAIRLDQGSAFSSVTRNLFLSGQRVAVLVDGYSDHVKLRENIIWKREGAGVKFLRTSCGLAENNLILDNRQKGIEVRKSDGTVVQGNLIAGNNSAGVWVSAQGRNARTALTGNILMANGAGLAAATGAQIYLQGNNLSGQLPRLLDGDISWLTRNIVTDLRGAKALHIDGGQAEAVAQPASLCGSDL